MDSATLQMNRRIQAFFDRLATEWDTMRPPEMAGRIERLADMLPLEPGMRVLDIGAGTGAFFEATSKRIAPDGSIAAVDLAREMLERSRAADFRAFPIQGDALALPFPPQTFDAALCFNVFPHFSCQGGALRECARTVRRGGFVAVMHSQSREDINELHRKAGGLIGGHCLPEDAPMLDLFASAGLNVTMFHSTPEIYLVCAKKTQLY